MKQVTPVRQDLGEELLVCSLAQLFERRQIRRTVAAANTIRRKKALTRCRSVALVKPHQALHAYSNLATTTDQKMIIIIIISSLTMKIQEMKMSEEI